MPDPRATFNPESIDANYVTLIPDNATIVFDQTQIGGVPAATLNKAVSFSASQIVQLAADADAVFGKLIAVENDLFCTVQFEGFMRLPGGLAATLTPGTHIVGATGAAAARGFIRSVNTAVAAELGKMWGRIVDATDATNVQVDY